MARLNDDDFDWQPVIGRALAFLCLDRADLGSATVLEKAEFLMGLGLPRKEAAIIVGSTDDSLRVLTRQRAARSAPTRKKNG